MLGGVLAAGVMPRFGWRGLYAIGGALPLLFTLVLLAALPESPRFFGAASGAVAAPRGPAGAHGTCGGCGRDI
jgi:MFS family permease